MLNSFAGGLFLATSICAAVYYSTDQEEGPEEPKESDSKTLTVTEMKAELEASDYVVYTSEEYNQKLDEVKQATLAEVENKEEEQPAENGDKVKEVVFYVTQGMTSIDVGKILVETDIIENANQFSKEVENKGVQNRLRPGMYKVNSEMTVDQIIDTVF